MHRRRLILVAALLLLFCGLFVSWPDTLADEEQALVGTWQTREGCDGWSLTFTANHKCLRHTPRSYPTQSTGRWWVSGGQVFLDFEPNPLRRALRPLLIRLGLPVTSVGSTDKEFFEMMFVRSSSGGGTETGTGTDGAAKAVLVPLIVRKMLGQAAAFRWR
jgi:hypothetical protein